MLDLWILADASLQVNTFLIITTDGKNLGWNIIFYPIPHDFQKPQSRRCQAVVPAVICAGSNEKAVVVLGLGITDQDAVVVVNASVERDGLVVDGMPTNHL